MKYDALIYDCENIFDVDDPAHNMIRIDGLSQSEADDLCDIIMTQHGGSICLLPYKE